MSSWAWQQRPTTRDGNPSSAAKLVLVALADLADADGAAWPSVRYLAGMTGLSERSVYEQINRLADDGLLRKAKVATPHGAHAGYVLASPPSSDDEYATPPVDNRQAELRHGAVDNAPPRTTNCATAQSSKEDPSLTRHGSSARAHAHADDPRYAQLLDGLAARLVVPRFRKQLDHASRREHAQLHEAAATLFARGWQPDQLAARLTRNAHERIRRVMPWLAELAQGEIAGEPSPLEVAAAHRQAAEHERAEQQAAQDEAARTLAHRTAADVALAAIPPDERFALMAVAQARAVDECGEAPGPVINAAIRRHLRALAWERMGDRVSAHLPPGVPPPTTDHPDPTENGPQRALHVVRAGGAS